jgi:SPP1 gp7 family putative phage head morphogenesis protein
MPDGNPNQAIFDAVVRHRIALERATAADLKEVVKFLDEVKADIAARLARATPGRRAQLESLLEDARSIQGEAYRKITDSLSTRFRDRAAKEAEFHAEKFRAAGIEASINRLTGEAAFQAAMSRPMDGAILSDWLTELGEGGRRRVDKALRISWTEGESLGNAVRRVRATVDISKRSAQTLVRTANTHISNAVQQASAEANADIVKEVEWRSVLDSRTTWICRSRDGERYPIDSGPRPPAHPGCRSIVTEVLKDYAPPQRETYADWLKRQPASVQDEIIGPARGKLLRAGKFDVQDFVDLRGKPLTLDELAAIDASRQAAKKAKADKEFAGNARARAKGMASFRGNARNFRR